MQKVIKQREDQTSFLQFRLATMVVQKGLDEKLARCFNFATKFHRQRQRNYEILNSA